MAQDADRAELPPYRIAVLWRRLKEHRIAQWTAGYVAVAYGIQHAVILTSESLQWPNIVARVSMILLAVGLPVAMTFAWYHGGRAAHRISGGELAVVSAVLAGMTFAFYLFVRPATELAATAGIVTAAPAENALAVLPLANVSGDPKQDFFSDGMTDEIMSALARIPSLRVLARESAFAFKGKAQDVRVIGRALGARYLVEGSVREAGARVRITAQLVRAADGVSLWTENYDRELKDIFAVQEDVARAIAVSLQAPLGLKQHENLVSSRGIAPSSYQDYLRARALFRSRTVGSSLRETIQILLRVVAADPGYAPAWAVLGQAYAVAPTYDPAVVSSLPEEKRRLTNADLDLSEQAARKAIALDPRSPDAFVGLSAVEFLRGKLLDAEQAAKQALSLDPLNPDALHAYSTLLATAGHLREAIAIRGQLAAVDPLAPVFNAITALILVTAGENEKALAVAEHLPPTGFRSYTLAYVYAALGRYKEAADVANTAPREAYPPGAVDAAVRVLRNAPERPTGERPFMGIFGYVLAYVGYPEGALAVHDFLTQSGADYIPYQIWQAELRPLRKSARFKSIIRRLGLVDYWRARGWPEFCHPTIGDDFECN